MSNFFLAWELGGGAGHCANLLPIAERLIARGANVTLAARDLATAKLTFGDLSLRYLQAPFLLGSPAEPVARPRSLAQILHNTGFGTLEHVQVLSSAWRHLIEYARPDVILCEHAPMALLASHCYDVPRGVLGTGFFSPPDVSPLPDLRYWEPGSCARAALDEKNVLDRVNCLLDENGCASLERISQIYDVEENFLLTFRELDHYPTRGDAEYWGMWSLSCSNPPRWPEGPAPRVFAYVKPSSARWKLNALLGLLRELKLTSLVYVSHGDEKALAPLQTSRLHIVTQAVNMDRVSEECDLAILNGNAGTCTKLLLAGVPQINIPLYLEQSLFSRRIVELGAGLMAEPDRPEQVAARIVSFLSSDRYTAAAKEFAQKYAEFDPEHSIKTITDRIVQLTRSRQE